jgi:hypothetical protein
MGTARKNVVTSDDVLHINTGLLGMRCRNTL